MTVSVSHTTIDCHDAYTLSEWWKQMLGYTDILGDPNEPGDGECMIVDPDTAHRLLFIEVPDAALPAKRIHFDVRLRRRSRDDEVDHLLARGATLVADHRASTAPAVAGSPSAIPKAISSACCAAPGEPHAEH